MNLTDYILPKWKNSDPDVRIKAIQEMDSSSMDLIMKMAETDIDVNVRIQAIQKIEDDNFLKNLLQKDLDESIRPIIINRLDFIYFERLIQTQDESTQFELLKKINDEKILADCACRIVNPNVRIKAIEKISSPPLLCKIAESNCGLKAGIAIIEKLSLIEFLQKIAKNASNKKIRKLAEEKILYLEENANSSSPEKNIQWDLEDICLKIENLLIAEKWDNAVEVINGFESKWRSVDPTMSHNLRTRFENTKQLIYSRIQEYNDKDKQILILKDLCSKTNELKANVEKLSKNQYNHTQIKKLEDEMWTYKDDWKNHMSDIKSELIPFSLLQNLKERFESDIKYIDQKLIYMTLQEKKRQIDFKQIEDLCNSFETIANSPDLNQAQQQWNETLIIWDQKLSECTTNDLSSFKKRFDKIFAHFKQRVENLKAESIQLIEIQKEKMVSLCQMVEDAIQAENRSGLEKEVMAAQQEWKDLKESSINIPNDYEERFKDACKNFYNIQRDYWHNKDWERWANLNIKEELCQQVEQLALSQSLDGLAEKLFNAQTKWKSIGSVAKDKSEPLWKRFKTACDKIYQNCYDRKKQLYEDLVNCTGNLDETTHWKNTAEKVKAIQAEWNQIGFLPRHLEKELRDDFQTICNTFFEKQKQFFRLREKARNQRLVQLKAICEEAESLAEGKDWIPISQRLKELQHEWKTVGPVSKNEGDRLWKRFRKACNSFFDRLNDEKPKNAEKKQILCNTIDDIMATLSEHDDIEAITKKVIDAQQEWKSIGPVDPPLSEELWNVFHSKCNAFFDYRKTYFKNKKEEQKKNQQIKEKLVEQAEQMANSTQWKETSEQLKTLQKEWQNIAPASRRIERQLWERFNDACDYFFSKQAYHFESLDQKKIDLLKHKERLCLSLEILAKLTRPHARFEYNKFIPLSEQLSISLGFKDEIVVPGDEKATMDNVGKKIKHIQKEWDSIDPISDHYDQTLLKRFQKGLELFTIQSK